MIVALALASCTSSNSVICDDGQVCPEGTVCVTLTVPAVAPEHCAPNSSVDDCAKLDDFAPCMTTSTGTPGVCYPIAAGGHACLPGGCGNGITDPDETCDDANAVAGDGCSASCTSNETCGNGTLDPVVGEHCDDANAQSHDGCAFDCKQIETALWTQLVGGPPDARGDVALGYDSARGLTVMFGGVDNSNSLFFADTWIYDGSSWTKAEVSAGPSERAGARVAYDVERGQLVLFGGYLRSQIIGFPENDFFADTWVWQGAGWTPVATGDVPHPAERANHMMAYDPIRKRLVLFGGETFGEIIRTAVGDTWEWDGSAWTELHIAGPDPRASAAMAFDPTTGKIVLFGGRGTGGQFYNDTWQFDGTAWTLLPPSSPPAGRYSQQMGFDITSGHLVMFGGIDASTTERTETYQWSGTAWSLLAPGAHPSQVEFGLTNDRNGKLVLFGGNHNGSELDTTWHWLGATWFGDPIEQHPQLRFSAAAFDALRGVTVEFGGGVDSGSPDSSETWELHDRSWTRASVAAPPARHGAAMAYDAAHAKTVMFGGCVLGAFPCDPSTRGDTWLWTGTAWSNVGGTQPPPRAFAAMAYDAAHKRIVMFGGYGTGALDETWLFDGATWTPAQPATKPDPRWQAALAYDPIRQKVVLFGGLGGTNGPLDDTWQWDGTTWTRIATHFTPEPRSAPAFAYSPDRRRMVLFGGAYTSLASAGDTWELDGDVWSFVAPAVSPPGRGTAIMTQTSDGTGVVLVGGGPGSRLGSALDDTWLFRYASAERDDTCRDERDDDHDSAKGCADRDCWATCTPLCPPGAPCDAAAPKCGDGTCNAALESCRSCPTDCGACTPRCGDAYCDGNEAQTCPGDCP